MRSIDFLLARSASGLEPVVISGRPFVRVSPGRYVEAHGPAVVEAWRITFADQAEAELVLEHVAPIRPPATGAAEALRAMIARFAAADVLPELELALEADAIERRAAPAAPGWDACDQAAALALERAAGQAIARCECGPLEAGHRRVFHVRTSGACTVAGCPCEAYRERGDR